MNAVNLECIITNVKKFPCLWNSHKKEYKFYEIKNAAWNVVVRECGLTDVTEAKNLWKNLRDGHRQAMVKRRYNSKSAWKYDKQMKFLLPIMRNRLRQRGKMRYHEYFNRKEQSADPLKPVQHNDRDSKPSIKSTVLKEDRNINRCHYGQSHELRGIIVNGGHKPKQHLALEKFFTCMYLTTNQLPQKLQLRVQRRIFDIVMEAKEESLSS